MFGLIKAAVGAIGLYFGAREADKEWNGGKLSKAMSDATSNPGKAAAGAVKKVGEGVDYLTARDGGALDDLADAGTSLKNAKDRAAAAFKESDGSVEHTLTAAITSPKAAGKGPASASPDFERSADTSKEGPSLFAQIGQYAGIPAVAALLTWWVTKSVKLAGTVAAAVAGSEVFNFGITDLFNAVASDSDEPSVIQELASSIGLTPEPGG